jgi:hypothetical protein
MSFYRDTIRKARKEHKCDICHGSIHIGDKYHDKAGINYDNEFFCGKECEACQPVIGEFMKSDCADEGYCDEYIADWWINEKCYICKHRFLPCEPNDCDCASIYMDGGQCDELTPYGTCKAGDTCDDMTHYCRCERFEPEG